MAYNPLYLIFFILALVYAVMTLFAVIRTVKLHRFSPRWGHTKAFYAMVVVTTVVRTIAFLVMFLQELKNIDSFFMLLSVPDSVFTLAFILLFWQFIIVFTQSHMDDLVSLRLLRTEGKLLKSHLPPYIFTCSIGWVLLQLSLYLSYILNAIESSSVGNEIGVANLLFPTIVLVAMLVQQIRYAGNPPKSPTWASKLKKVRLITIIWCLGRYFRGVLSMITEVTDYSLSREVVNDNSNVNLSHLAILIAYLICSEVICIFLVLDYSFITIFAFIESEHYETDPLELNTEGTDSVRSSMTSEDSPLRRFTVVSDKAIVLTSEVNMGEAYRRRRGGLGELRIGQLFGHEVLVRKIVFPRISGYIIEEFEEEIQALRTVSVPYILPIHAAAVNLPELCLITPYVSSGSLYDWIHVEKKRLSDQEKVQVILKVAKGMTSVYELGRKHGHLSSHNILIDSNQTPYISDVGMHKLKKYAGILINYSNKSAWSSPELLSESCSTSLRITESDDIYSLGVIMWELFTSQEPFPGVNRQKLVQMMARDQLRPQIPRTVDDRIAELIKSCWNTEPKRRPNFGIVAKTMEAIGLTIRT